MLKLAPFCIVCGIPDPLLIYVASTTTTFFHPPNTGSLINSGGPAVESPLKGSEADRAGNSPAWGGRIDHGSPVESETERRLIVRLVFIVFLLLIFEGALRRWALPDYVSSANLR